MKLIWKIGCSWKNWVVEGDSVLCSRKFTPKKKGIEVKEFVSFLGSPWKSWKQKLESWKPRFPGAIFRVKHG